MLKIFNPNKNYKQNWVPVNAMDAEVFRRKHLMLATYSENVFILKDRLTDEWIDMW